MDVLTGVIVVKHSGPSFDRELVARHHLTVEARDDFGKGNRNTAQLIINIDDLNDNPPIFIQNKYEAVLLENEDHFEAPLVVEATDKDLNGEIMFNKQKKNYKNNLYISTYFIRTHLQEREVVR